MAISFACPRCGKKLKAPDNAVGKTSKCPGCGSPVTCPEPVYDAELVDAAPGGVDPYSDFDTDKPYSLVEPQPGAAPGGDAPLGEARRPCPMCGEMIVATAAKCRFCGEVFDPALKKAKKKGRRSRAEDEDLSTSEIVIAILCSGIGCIAGLVWLIQGKPKGGKMLGISVVMIVVWNIIGAVLRQIGEQGGP
jgi:predicted RNA-binding Zn-ribbon protein involved in translation (DUF1610 family)